MPNPKPPPVPPPRPEDDRTRNVLRTLALWLLLPMAILFLVNLFQLGRDAIEAIPYNPNFVSLVENQKIRKCEIVTELSGGQYIRGEMTEPDARTGKPRVRAR